MCIKGDYLLSEIRIFSVYSKSDQLYGVHTLTIFELKFSTYINDAHFVFSQIEKITKNKTFDSGFAKS